MTELHLVKRKGHLEKFDEKKAFASVYWAARSAHVSEQEAERLAAIVCKALLHWLSERKNISSDDLFQFIGPELARHHADAGYMYQSHRDIS